jgi:hypothetical protein
MTAVRCADTGGTGRSVFDFSIIDSASRFASYRREASRRKRLRPMRGDDIFATIVMPGTPSLSKQVHAIGESRTNYGYIAGATLACSAAWLARPIRKLLRVRSNSLAC